MYNWDFDVDGDAPKWCTQETELEKDKWAQVCGDVVMLSSARQDEETYGRTYYLHFPPQCVLPGCCSGDMPFTGFENVVFIVQFSKQY
jgi:hypothetical protein